LQIPVLVLSQLTRAPERDERGPQLSDLRESGAIEQDADVVMFIYRPNFFKEGRHPEEREETELRIAKQRNGPTDTVRFVFRSRLTRFEEAAPTPSANSLPAIRSLVDFCIWLGRSVSGRFQGLATLNATAPVAAADRRGPAKVTAWAETY